MFPVRPDPNRGREIEDMKDRNLRTVANAGLRPTPVWVHSKASRGESTSLLVVKPQITYIDESMSQGVRGTGAAKDRITRMIRRRRRYLIYN